MRLKRPDVSQVVAQDDAMRLKRPDVSQDLGPLPSGVLVVVAVDPEQVDRPVARQQFGQLLLNETRVVARGLRRQSMKVRHSRGGRVPWMAQRLRAGGVWANTYNRFDPASPFGGYRESGFGREGGRHGLAAYIDG